MSIEEKKDQLITLLIKSIQFVSSDPEQKWSLLKKEVWFYSAACFLMPAVLFLEFLKSLIFFFSRLSDFFPFFFWSKWCVNMDILRRAVLERITIRWTVMKEGPAGGWQKQKDGILYTQYITKKQQQYSPFWEKENNTGSQNETNSNNQNINVPWIYIFR